MLRRQTARARYGTGDFLNLKKRDCPIRMELVPQGSNHLMLLMDIGDDHHEFYASSVMGGQFSYFVKALFSLYEEKRDPHRCFGSDVRVNWKLPTEDSTLEKGEIRPCASFHWDGEGSLHFFYLSRTRSEGLNNCFPENDPVKLVIKWTWRHDGPKNEYVVEGRDLCYAVAKAVTDCWKKTGFYGYYRSTGDCCDCCEGDVIDLQQFLFIKAYALGAMEARRLTPFDPDFDEAEASSFDKEIELLLFDM